MTPFLAALALSHSGHPSAADVLAHVRRAVGYAVAGRLSAPVEATGKAHESGLDGEFRFVFAADGSYLFSNTGPISSTKAWDTKSGWERDPSGATMTLELSDLEYQHAISWVLDNEWLDPNGPFVVTVTKEELTDGGSYTLNLKQKNGLQEQTVTIDKKSWMPKGTAFSIGELDYSMTFTKWRDFGGYKLPGRIDALEGKLKSWYTIEKTRKLSAAVSPFKRPAWTVLSDTAYDRTKPGVVESKRAFTGHILVHPTVQGKDVGWFILDSGAGGMAIDPKAAESLGAKKFGEINVGGVGGVEQSGFYTLGDFSLGQATVKKMNFIGVDLGMIGNIFGVKLAGIVGYDFFRRATVEVDVEDGRVAVFSPHAYGNEKATWMRLALDGRHPTVTAEFEGGHSGLFRIDTGADGTVTFNTPVVQKYKMLEGRAVSDSALAGVGGMVPVKTGVIESFVLGGKTFSEIQAMFCTSQEGIFNDQFLAGNIGQELLRPFRLVLDYPNQRLALVLKDQD